MKMYSSMKIYNMNLQMIQPQEKEMSTKFNDCLNMHQQILKAVSFNV